ncbi:ATP-binding protein, partial [Glutamicibacter creatinolyticus]
RDPSMFGQDPVLKSEAVWFGPVLRPSTTSVLRQGALVQIRGQARLEDSGLRLPEWESVLSAIDASSAPEVSQLRVMLQGWRFYDALRTDAG